ncbi:Asp23/Gls24 family envelope stress response protein [candidate division WWE3 bacterium CG_4_9_14_3_um_filter_39_7]|uniref:Asp23/Gls24 family envelope stress response protein n=1 Tax=candidate division WWE3 bacterium CG_4_9_14_3_um_filter_39_7 TaxID=1975080 RepID=A0A2M7X436_UNCKA|nr:MAG: Asp23/Gls24 family envelope stress response protein [candidate division WWE3 bacterium CG_4_9_14_3_um_filter_39_7]
MLQQDERRNEYGLVKIHKNVVAQIASMAAKEVEGVNRISANIITRALNVITKGKSVRYPGRIEFLKNNEVAISIGIIVNYGVNIPEVAASVQENIKKTVENMTGLYPVDIHIKVKGVEAR